MTESKNRCRLYFQIPAQPSAKLEAQLAQALDSTDAACVLLCIDATAADESCSGRLLDLVQARGRACLVEGDIVLAERLGADGAHLAADANIYRDARAGLGESANIGVYCGLSRHDAMSLAELGADYVAFGPGAESQIDAIDQCAELIAWWSEIFVVPCVAWNIDQPADAARLAALGADFVAPSKTIWRADQAERRIAEIDSAIRQARRAA
jgi:thiamine-phosphate pyrophosphorylase